MILEVPDATELSADMAIAGFAALAHATRLGLFRRLVRRGLSGESAGDLARGLGIPPQTASFHLKEMVNAQLLRQWRSGRHVFYSIDFDHMNRLRDYLGDCCCVDEEPAPVSRRRTR